MTPCQLPIEQVGSVIRIGRNDDPKLRQDVAISYQITVPKETRLHALTGSGNQTIEGITGPADVQTGSGSIHLREVKTGVRSKTGSGSIIAENTGGGFEGHTGSGSVHFIQATPGDVEITTGSGSVEAAAVQGALSIHTGSGSVRAEGQPTGSWNLDTGSGSVKLGLPQIGFNLNAHTGSGGITVNHPLIVQETIRKNESIGTVRGGGIPIQIRTGSGSIRVE